MTLRRQQTLQCRSTSFGTRGAMRGLRTISPRVAPGLNRQVTRPVECLGNGERCGYHSSKTLVRRQAVASTQPPKNPFQSSLTSLSGSSSIHSLPHRSLARRMVSFSPRTTKADSGFFYATRELSKKTWPDLERLFEKPRGRRCVVVLVHAPSPASPLIQEQTTAFQS